MSEELEENVEPVLLERTSNKPNDSRNIFPQDEKQLVWGEEPQCLQGSKLMCEH